MAAQAEIQKKSAENHKQMLGQLHISTLRPGPSGDPKAPNYANVDESQATPYTSLPDPLRLKNGRKVTTAKQWWNQRRAEIVEDFDREIYGCVPKNVPKATWNVVSETRETNGDFPIITKNLVGHVDNSAYPAINVDIELVLSTPANATGPVPVVMSYGFRMPTSMTTSSTAMQTTKPEPTWQQQLLAKGWGYAIIYPTSYQPDNGAGLTQGINGPGRR